MVSYKGLIITLYYFGGSFLASAFETGFILAGSGDLVSRVIILVIIVIRIALIKVPITLLTKSHDPPSRV